MSGLGTGNTESRTTWKRALDGCKFIPPPSAREAPFVQHRPQPETLPLQENLRDPLQPHTRDPQPNDHPSPRIPQLPQIRPESILLHPINVQVDPLLRILTGVSVLLGLFVLLVTGDVTEEEPVCDRAEDCPGGEERVGVEEDRVRGVNEGVAEVTEASQLKGLSHPRMVMMGMKGNEGMVGLTLDA